MDFWPQALLWAQAAKDQQGPPGWTTLMPFVAIAFFAYFFLIRPQQRQEQQRRDMVSTLKKNDRVVNHGGIIGVVEQIKEKEDEVVLKGGIRIVKSSIVRIMGDEDKDKDKDKEKDKE